MPSLSEAGIKGLEGIDPYTYYGVVGPAGVPAAIVTKLNDSINTLSKSPEIATQVRERLFNEPAETSPAAFRKFVEKDLAKWRELSKYVKLSD